MTSRNLAARNEMVDWQVAPAEHEIANYDEPKIRYRRYVEDIVDTLPTKTVRKKPFFTISSNVLCADIFSKGDDIDPIYTDIYLPLEISIVKWCVNDALVPEDLRILNVKHWMINPGPPTMNSISRALDHRKKHKIYFNSTKEEDYTQNPFIENDLVKLMKEINSFLTPDRTVYSLGLKYCRQDLGSLKWLNRETGSKMKPIKVYSLEDLYVALIRRFNPERPKFVGQGLARFRMECSDSHDPLIQCIYHLNNAKEDSNEECCYCTKALSQSYTNRLLDDVGNLVSALADSQLPDLSDLKLDDAIIGDQRPSQLVGH